MSIQNFTCEKCGRVSAGPPTACPECGTKPPGGTYLAPVDPIKNERFNIKMFEVGKYLFLIFGICAISFLIPFLIMPIASGPDIYGQYELPRSRTQAPTPVSGATIMIASVVIVIASAALFIGYFYTNRKHLQRKAAFIAAGHTLIEAPWKKPWERK